MSYTIMSEDSVIVWDLETVPDLKAAARMSGMGEEPEEKIREAIGSGFPKPPLHSIACIGALVATREADGWRVAALGAPHINERPEPELIRTFVDRIEQLRPLLVTFNGNGFDLPVLRYRALLHRVPAPGLHARPYFNRYTNDAVDLCDVLASFGSSPRMKLDELSRFLGLAGKPHGLEGGKVESMVAAGQIDEVARYCETDIVNTYRLWLIYELFRGALSPVELQWSEGQLRDYVHQHKTANSYLLSAMELMMSP
jgi:predicted PolB exonuclease-like 3'-5' exonuclease